MSSISVPDHPSPPCPIPPKTTKRPQSSGVEILYVRKKKLAKNGQFKRSQFNVLPKIEEATQTIEAARMKKRVMEARKAEFDQENQEREEKRRCTSDYKVRVGNFVKVWPSGLPLDVALSPEFVAKRDAAIQERRKQAVKARMKRLMAFLTED